MHKATYRGTASINASERLEKKPHLPKKNSDHH